MKGLLSSAFIERRANQSGARRFAAERNVRATERFSRHEAPDPIRQGDTPARPSRMPIVTFLAIAPYKAVMKDEFWLAIVAPHKGAHTLAGPGHHSAWSDRVNIAKDHPEAYGDIATFHARDEYSSLTALMK